MRWLALLVAFAWPSVVAAQEADLRVESRAVYELDGGVRTTAVVTNAGPDDVMDVDIIAQFDLENASATELPAGCSGSSVGVVCSFSEIDAPVLAVDEELLVEFLVTPDGADGEVVFDVASTTSDPDESNNTDSVALDPPTTVDVGIDERGLQAPAQNTLIFTVRNNGPDTASGVSVTGTVTISFDDNVVRGVAEELTRISPNDEAVCNRRVPDSEGSFERWTFPVSCSIRDLSVDDEVEFRFEFEQGNNAVFRLTASSEGRDTDLANNVTDGDFLNSPLEVIEGDDKGCCATAASPSPSTPLGLIFAALILRARRRIN